MGYVIYDNNKNVVGKLFFDANECIFREENFSGVKDELIFELQSVGISKYKKLESGCVLCLVGKYKVNVDLENLLLSLEGAYGEELKVYHIQKGYPVQGSR